MPLSRPTVRLIGVLVALSFCSSGFAQTGTLPAHSTRGSVGVVAPIFSQLVYFRVPASFVSVFENAHDGRYIHEWTMTGESVLNWTQMVTVTGAQNLSVKRPEMTPKAFASAIAHGFQRACPSSFAAKEVYDGKLSARDAFIMIVSCGNAAASAGHSETAVIAVIKGERDFYTLQWAQRGDSTPTPVAINADMWTARFKSLMPLKLCPVIAGERPPYPSCVGGRAGAQSLS
jgi:hypothetical protein